MDNVILRIVYHHAQHTVSAWKTHAHGGFFNVAAVDCHCDKRSVTEQMKELARKHTGLSSGTIQWDGRERDEEHYIVRKPVLRAV